MVRWIKAYVPGMIFLLIAGFIAGQVLASRGINAAINVRHELAPIWAAIGMFVVACWVGGCLLWVNTEPSPDNTPTPDESTPPPPPS